MKTSSGCGQGAPASRELTVCIAVASDHAGLPLKSIVRGFLLSSGHEAEDLGSHTSDPVDYPDCAARIGQAVVTGMCERGVLICASGVGATLSANKIRGAEGRLCHDTYSAHQGVEHDDMNVLVLGGRVIGEALAHELVRAFISARFTREERHQRRLAKVHALEEVI